MEKIKLEWGYGSHGNESNKFNFKGIDGFEFGVYNGSGYVKMYNNGESYKVTLGFPQNHPIKSVEEGRQFCQDWLDALVEKENRKERVQKVLEDIWNGKTELVWEKTTESCSIAKFYHNSIPYHFCHSSWSNSCIIYESHEYACMKTAHDKFGVKGLNSKENTQDWYNKYLLEQASK